METKRIKSGVVHRHSTHNNVILDGYNCDLTTVIKEDYLRGETMIDGGLCSLWSGMRATCGVNHGRVAFQIKIGRQLSFSNLLDGETPFGIRVGWSVDECQLRLGEDSLSYGYEGTGQIWTKSHSESYGTRYSTGDTITCYADFESEPGNVVLSFAKNALKSESAFHISYRDLQSRPLFPHIFLKNLSFQANFGQLATKFPLRSGFRFINDYHEDDRIRGTLAPSRKEECEVIMMVGLSGAGKSLWVQRHCITNPDKKYVVLSTNSMISRMQIGNNAHSDEVIQRASDCLQLMFDLAVCQKRNFIIDQMNINGNTRRAKMSRFDGFYRRAVVIIPDDREYQQRRYKQRNDQEKIIPVFFINQMKAHFDLPEVGDVFDDVEYAELAFREARELVRYYRRQSLSNKEITRRNPRRTKNSRKHLRHQCR